MAGQKSFDSVWNEFISADYPPRCAVRELRRYPDLVAKAMRELLSGSALPGPWEKYRDLLAELSSREVHDLAHDMVSGRFPGYEVEGIPLFAWHATSEDTALLLGLLGTVPENCRDYVVWAIGVNRVRPALPILRRMIAERGRPITHAILALGRMGEAEDLPLLDSFLVQPYESEGLAEWAAVALGLGRYRGAVPKLVNALPNRDRVAIYAERSLREITGEDCGWAWQYPEEERTAAIKRWRALSAGRAESRPPFEVLARDDELIRVRTNNGQGIVRIEPQRGQPGSWPEWYVCLWVRDRPLLELNSICDTCLYWLREVDPSAAEGLTSAVQSRLDDLNELDGDALKDLWPILRILRNGLFSLALLRFVPERIEPDEDRGPLWEITRCCGQCRRPVDTPYYAGLAMETSRIPEFPETIHTAVVPIQAPAGLDESRVAHFESRLSSGAKPAALALGHVALHRHLDYVGHGYDWSPTLLRLYTLDGHHKVEAAARTRQPLNFLVALDHSATSVTDEIGPVEFGEQTLRLMGARGRVV